VAQGHYNTIKIIFQINLHWRFYRLNPDSPSCVIPVPLGSGPTHRRNKGQKAVELPLTAHVRMGATAWVLHTALMQLKDSGIFIFRQEMLDNGTIRAQHPRRVRRDGHLGGREQLPKHHAAKVADDWGGSAGRPRQGRT
jgi:hypothetical protein